MSIIILSAAASFGFLHLFEKYDSIPIDCMFIKIAIVSIVAIVYPLVFLLFRCIFCKNIGNAEIGNAKGDRSVGNELQAVTANVKKETVSDQDVMSDIVTKNDEQGDNGVEIERN